MKRLNVLCLLGLVAAAISLACSEEVPERETAPTVGAIAPTATTATVLPTAAPVAATVRPIPTAISTEVPTPTAAPTPIPTAGPRVESRTSGDNGALVILRSRSTAAPSRLGSGNFGGLSLSPLPQMMAGEGSLTVSAVGTVTVAPDEAYVVVIPETNYGPSGPQQFSAEDRMDVVANLVAIGLNEEAVEFEHLGRYEPSIISVEVEVDEYANRGDAIVDAVEEVVRRSESYGVRFGLSRENCDRAVSLARREAVPAAEEAVNDLADALELERGEVIGALEYPLQNLPYGLPGVGLDPCIGQNTHRFVPLLPFDSEPEVDVSVGLQVSYRIR